MRLWVRGRSAVVLASWLDFKPVCPRSCGCVSAVVRLCVRGRAVVCPRSCGCGSAVCPRWVRGRSACLELIPRCGLLLFRPLALPWLRPARLAGLQTIQPPPRPAWRSAVFWGSVRAAPARPRCGLRPPAREGRLRASCAKRKKKTPPPFLFKELARVEGEAAAPGRAVREGEAVECPRENPRENPREKPREKPREFL